MVLPRGHNLPIDTFFCSLAQDQGSNAICIVLSGTGTDGTLGLLAVKGESGLAMAQELASARYDSMPRNAIGTGRVDFVLPPDKMPEQLLRYVSHTKKNQFSKINIVDKSMNNSLQKIFVLLRAHTGHDFSLYKKNTLCRRIERRMHIHQIDNVSDYVRYLQESSREISVLFKELLIGVTHFFRDSDAFNQLQNIFLPDLLQDKPDDYTIRIWVPGCSSGEEPYSIAIVVKECMARLGRHFNVQIFATDIDETAINEARSGVYPESIAADVNAERLEKYFIKEENHFHLKKTIREMVVFAQQNIIKDPPFTKLDMLCCRNLLIYFNQELQKKLLPIFHYSLKAEGLLFLGSSETIGQYTELFIALDKKCKIFKRTSSETVGYPVLYFPPQRGSVVMQEKKVPGSVKNVKGINTFKLLQSILSQSDIPACVVIDDQANIIYIHGKTGRFLEPAQGEVSVNIVEMARNGLKAGLTGAIHKLVTNRQETVVSGLQVKDIGGFISVNLRVRPLPHFETGQRGLVLVIFEEVVTAHNKVQQKTLSTSGRHAKIDEVRRLENELQYTRENLQTTIEELETSNEELRSTNEELQSTNEELQSTNEELETSKEELQSLHEESTTVNAELQSRIDELVKANDDIKNLLDAIEIATIFLDINLGVRRFTPKANELFPLTIIDIGRPIMHFASSLQGIDLQQHAQKVLDDLTMQEMEVDDKQGKIFRMRIRPYRTVNNVIDGVVITFEDITKIKKIEVEISRLSSGFEEKLLMMSKVFTDGVDPIIIEDMDGMIIEANEAATVSFGWSREELLGNTLKEFIQPSCYEQVKQIFEKCRAGEKIICNIEGIWRHRYGTDIATLSTFTPLTDLKGSISAIAITVKNIFSGEGKKMIPEYEKGNG
jgi:two-component system CheB/CheR fusion protein